MPSMWSYSDPADRGYGLFKRRIFHALKALGWQTHLAEAPLLDPASKALLREDLAAHPSDWIFLINQPAAQFYEYIGWPPSQRPLPSQKLVWYLDDPHFFIQQPLDPNEHVVCFDETYLDYVETFKPASCGFWPLGADMEGAGVYREALACDVCFVGGLVDQSFRRVQLSPAMQAYVDRLIEKKVELSYVSFEELISRYPIAPGKCIQLNPQVMHYLYWETNNRYRMQVLEALTDFDLRIYGNKDWPALIASSPLQRFFCGEADPVRELPDIFVSSKININIHSIQCMGSLNQRDFNAPVAGGFLLSDWVPACAKYFTAGEEAIYWSDIFDLRAKIAYYLHHADEREAIVQKGRERVLRDHTYTQRVTQLLQTLPM
jgi:hypothetical protein